MAAPGFVGAGPVGLGHRESGLGARPKPEHAVLADAVVDELLVGKVDEVSVEAPIARFAERAAEQELAVAGDELLDLRALRELSPHLRAHSQRVNALQL